MDARRRVGLFFLRDRHVRKALSFSLSLSKWNEMSLGNRAGHAPRDVDAPEMR